MNDITVTMPIKEYERLKNRIKELEARDVENFVVLDYSDIRQNVYEIKLNKEELVRVLDQSFQKELHKRSMGAWL